MNSTQTTLPIAVAGLLDEKEVGAIKKEVKNNFKNVTFITTKSPITQSLKIEIRFNYKDLKRVKEVCDNCRLDYKETHKGVIEVAGKFFTPLTVIKKEQVRVEIEMDPSEVVIEGVQAEAESVGIDDPRETMELNKNNFISEKTYEMKDMTEKVKDFLHAFLIPGINVIEHDRDTFILNFDLTKRQDKIKFTELTQFCSLIKDGGSKAMIKDEKSSEKEIGEVLIDCNDFKIPASDPSRPIRRKALEKLLEEEKIIYAKIGGCLESRVVVHDSQMKMIISFKYTEMIRLRKLRTKLHDCGFQNNFVNEEAQNILIVNYRMVDKSIQHYELLERSEPGYLRARFVNKLPSNPEKLYVNSSKDAWYIALKGKDLEGVSYEDYALKLKSSGYDFLRYTNRLLILPSLNPASAKILAREISETHRDRLTKEEVKTLPVVTTFVEKREVSRKSDDRPTALKRLAGLVQGLTEDKSHDLINKIELLLAEDAKPKKIEKILKEVHKEIEPIDEAKITRKVIKEMIEKGLIVLDPNQDLSVPYDNVKMKPGNRWKVVIDGVKSMNPTEILRFIQE